MIPDEAIHAALDMLPYQAADYVDMDTMRAALEAAAPHMLAGAWEDGAAEAWARSTPEVNGAAYQWRHEGEPRNPHRPTP